MNGNPTSLTPEVLGASEPSHTWTSRLMTWMAEARSHRVICVVMGIWMLNAFDLIFTLLSHRHGLLDEENPIARFVLGNGTLSIVLFKVGLVLIGSYPLLRFRRVRLAELASYVVLAAYAFLAIRWSTCFELYSAALPGQLDLAGLEDLTGTARH